MRAETLDQGTPTQTSLGEQTTQKPERELTPEEKFDIRLDEIIDPSIIFTDPNKAKNEIKTARDDFTTTKVDIAVESISKENEELKNEIEKRKMYNHWDIDENEEDEEYRKYLEEYRRNKKNKSSKK